MTLNLTVVSRERIYQCADYRLSNPRTRQAIDIESQKIILVNAYRWSATVCYTGIAQLPCGTYVGDWLSAFAKDISPNEPFDHFLNYIAGADSWLRCYPLESRRISFSVGAFDVDQPVFVLISNFEEPSGRMSQSVAPTLTVHRVRPGKSKAYVAGLKSAVSRQDRRQLERLASRSPAIPDMTMALVDLNRRVARACPNLVSEACFTTHLSHTGNGGGDPHGATAANLSMMPSAIDSAVKNLIAEKFPRGGVLRGIAISRSPANERHHQILLKEKPNDPNLHNNFGAFLMDQKNDPEGAEIHYLKAIELDPSHANALGNLAIIRGCQRRLDEADALYLKALSVDETNETVAFNYTLFRKNEFSDVTSTRLIIDRAIHAHPESARLRILRAQNSIDADPIGAARDLKTARELGADQAQIEPYYALALHLGKCPIEDCIGAYRTALAIDPDNGALHLNLAQLLFVWGKEVEAKSELTLALRKKLNGSAELEALFYSLAHLAAEVAPTLTRVRSLLDAGARLNWDVSMNLKGVEAIDPSRAEQLELLVSVMRGELETDVLSRVACALR